MKKIILFLNLLFITTGIFFAQKIQPTVFTIESCIDYAFENNPYLKARGSEVLIALKDIAISKSIRLPRVNMSASYLFSDQYHNINKYTAANTGIEMFQPVWENGKLNAFIEQAKSSKNITEIQYQIEKNNLVFVISQQYLILLREQQLVALSNEMAQRIAVNVESAKERYKVGITRKSDIIKAETELSNAIFAITRCSTDLNIAERNLIHTIGADFDSKLTLANILNEIDYTYTTWDIDRFYQIATENLSELKLADQVIIRQNSVVKYNKRANGPEFGLSAGYSYLDTPLQNNNWFGTVGALMKFTIFNGFESKNKLARESIRVDQLEYEKEDLQRIVKLEIQQAFQKLLEARQQIENSQKQLENSIENLNTVREEYNHGISSMLELLYAENTYFLAAQNYINALSDYQIAKITIERKSGIVQY